MKSPSIILKPISKCDLPQLLLWRNDGRLFKWFRQYEPISEDHHLRWFENLKDDNTLKMFSIFNDENVLVGACGLTSIDYVNRRAEFSLYIGFDHASHGYGIAALKRLLTIAFSVYNLHQVWGEVFAGNPALDLFLKLGFKSGGLRRDFYYRDGIYINSHMISILRNEHV